MNIINDGQSLCRLPSKSNYIWLLTGDFQALYKANRYLFVLLPFSPSSLAPPPPRFAPPEPGFQERRQSHPRRARGLESRSLAIQKLPPPLSPTFVSYWISHEPGR